jgi:murein DD-endopeptidase MepM/ murein hydrolase activator NlpD
MRNLPVLLALLAGAALGLHAQPPDPAGPAGGLLSFAPEISCDTESEPGSVIRAQAHSPEGIDSLTAYLADTEGNVVSLAAAFPAESGTPASSWDALIGVPSTARRGEYRVLVTVSRLGRESLLLAPLSITRRAFRSENIALSQPLSVLRTEFDQRKVEEARRLAELLASARAENLFERGPFVFPVEGAVRTAGFGDRREYTYATGGSDAAVHNGLDLALPEGRPVSACAQGRVVMAGDRIVTGLSVVIEHLPGVYSLYFHMSDISVREGELVEKGALLGRVGRTGLATGPHLHWEISVRGVAVDPEPFVQGPILGRAFRHSP